MKWKEARQIYADKWLLFEAIEAHSENNRRVVEELFVINIFDKGNEVLKAYAEQHKKDKSREMYVYNTKNENLLIEERNWIGVRSNA